MKNHHERYQDHIGQLLLKNDSALFQFDMAKTLIKARQMIPTKMPTN